MSAARAVELLSLPGAQLSETLLDRVEFARIVGPAQDQVLSELLGDAEFLKGEREFRLGGNEPKHEIDVLAWVQDAQCGEALVEGLRGLRQRPIARLLELEPSLQFGGQHSVRLCDPLGQMLLPRRRLRLVLSRHVDAHAKGTQQRRRGSLGVLEFGRQLRRRGPLATRSRERSRVEPASHH